MSNVCAKCIGAETKREAAKRNYLDHKRRDQGYGAVQQVVPSVDLKSAAKRSQIWIGAAAAGGVHPLCRRATEGGPQKQRMPQEAQLA